MAYDGATNNLVTVTDAATGSGTAMFGRDALGRTLGLSDGAGAQLAFCDLRGDLIGAFTATGTSLIDSVAYNPFGEVITRTGAAHTLGYQGGYTDPASGKINMAARWYQPATGSFVSRDTLTQSPDPSIQLNRYAYANDNPLTNIDPDGHKATSKKLKTSNPVDTYGECKQQNKKSGVCKEIISDHKQCVKDVGTAACKKVEQSYTGCRKKNGRDDCVEFKQEQVDAYQYCNHTLKSKECLFMQTLAPECAGGDGNSAPTDRCKTEYRRQCLKDPGQQKCDVWMDMLAAQRPAWADGLSRDFTEASLFIYYEIVVNMETSKYRDLKELYRKSGLSVGLAKELYNMFETNARWDHKQYLRKLLHLDNGHGGLRNDGYICVTRECEKTGMGQMIHYDVFSNFHYGYLMAGIGFTPRSTALAPELYAFKSGENDIGDTLSALSGFSAFRPGSMPTLTGLRSAEWGLIGAMGACGGKQAVMSVADPPDTKFVYSDHKECSLDEALKLFHLQERGTAKVGFGYN
ncbi:RHS repeat-associated core domain-containing protein [Streptosporangium sp. NPDC087985]|uniref:RHS repeat-associated core domain-containing protein n=1 Tax=Streptosporangium sp. NPDC087985 TaxID=3366196 RepID=UPI00380B92DB